MMVSSSDILRTVRVRVRCSNPQFALASQISLLSRRSMSIIRCQLPVRCVSARINSTRFKSSPPPPPVAPHPEPLRLTEINLNAILAEYAVRGAVPTRAGELQAQLDDDPTSLPFKKIILSNIGNPQELGQKPLTWYRQVLALIQCPLLIVDAPFTPEVKARATQLLDAIGSVGAYSQSQGVPLVRRLVADYITERDQSDIRSDPDSIFLTVGASAAVRYLILLLSTGPNAGFLIPIPQYPLYTATIALCGSKAHGYYLDESRDWAVDVDSIRKTIADAAKEGVTMKSLVVINPGNPTGATLCKKDIETLIDVAVQNRLVIIADEVYQNNVFVGEFISFRKCLLELQAANPEKYKHVQLASLHSISKGVSGECGQRGGYMELIGFDPALKAVITKLVSVNLCSPVLGQALIELMVHPPPKGTKSYEVYIAETTAILEILESRAKTLHAAFEKMEDVTCNPPMGAMYLFPRFHFDRETYPRLFAECDKEKCQPDDFYCLSLLEATGICTVPGNGFGQVKGTWHVRTTFLPPGTDWIDLWDQFHREFVQRFRH